MLCCYAAIFYKLLFFERENNISHWIEYTPGRVLHIILGRIALDLMGDVERRENIEAMGEGHYIRERASQGASHGRSRAWAFTRGQQIKPLDRKVP